MEKTIGFIGIIVEDLDKVPELNKLLSEYGNSILGRMGLPCHDRASNIITVVIEAREEVIGAFVEKIQGLGGIRVKVAF